MQPLLQGPEQPHSRGRDRVLQRYPSPQLISIVNSPIADKLSFNIIDTFFFEGRRVTAYYHNDEHGRMVRSHVRGVEEIERILRDKRYVPTEAPLLRTERRVETAKEAVNRKIRNNIGIMVLNDGTYRFLNQLNISYQISTIRNVSFIKSYHTFKLIPVYFKHRQLKDKEMYKRAKVYLKSLSREITPFEINYIKKEEEYFYEQDLYNQNIERYLLYLTCKISQLVLMQECLLIRSGVFIWAVDGDSAAVYVGNVHNVRYTVEKNPNEILDRFIASKKELIERKLGSIGKRSLEKHPGESKRLDDRVLGFEEFLKQSFRVTLNEVAPRIDTGQNQDLDLDETFKKLHPEIKYNLSDIVRDNNRFNIEMKKMFNKPYKRRAYEGVGKGQGKDSTIQSSHTLMSSRTPRKSVNVRLQRIGGTARGETLTSRKRDFKIGDTKRRMRTEPSSHKLNP